MKSRKNTNKRFKTTLSCYNNIEEKKGEYHYGKNH